MEISGISRNPEFLRAVPGKIIVSLDTLRTVTEKWEFPEFPEIPEILRAVPGKIIVSLATLRTSSTLHTSI